MKKLLIDSDGGVDDALAILAALGAPEADVVALTTVAGNVGLDQAAANVALVRNMFDPACTVPVSPGGVPVQHKPRATAIHGQDGLGDIGTLRTAEGGPRYVWPALSPSPLSAAEQIRAQCGVHGAELTLVFIGPLTNLAEAVRHYGARALNGARVVIMGGSFSRRQKGVQRADFNIGADIQAAREVLASGVQPDFVPLELCENYILTRELLERMVREHPSAKARFIRDIHQHYMDYYFRKILESTDGCYPHDAIAVACAIRPDLFAFEPRAVEVTADSDGTCGHTILCPGAEPNARIATDFDAAAFEAHLEKWVWSE